MLDITFTKKFKKSAKLQDKRGKNKSKLLKVIELLANEKTLPKKYKDHMLIGNYKDCRECHIEPDWLLIYRIDNEEELHLIDTGTHSDLFKK